MRQIHLKQRNMCFSFLRTAIWSVSRIMWQWILRDSTLHKGLLINLKVRGRCSSSADIMYLCWLTLKPSFCYRTSFAIVLAPDNISKQVKVPFCPELLKKQILSIYPQISAIDIYCSCLKVVVFFFLILNWNFSFDISKMSFSANSIKISKQSLKGQTTQAHIHRTSVYKYQCESLTD